MKRRTLGLAAMLIVVSACSTTPRATGPVARRSGASPSLSTTATGVGKTGETHAVRHVFAPYVDITLHPTPDLAAIRRESGTTRFTLGFVVAGQNKCAGSWGAGLPVGRDDFTSRIKELRAVGGDVAIAFGGESGDELAMHCPSPEALAAQYQQVIDRYQVSDLDFDVEGSAARDAVSIDRRARALTLLQKQRKAGSTPLRVSFTILAEPAGLTAHSLAIVRSAIAGGVDIGLVNLMVMDFNPEVAPHPDGHMGTYAIGSLRNAERQMASMFPGLSEPEVWQKIGATPMLGQNDVRTEVFTPADAKLLAGFAREKGLSGLAMWSVTRDRQCKRGVVHSASGSCSGIMQAPWTFSRIFQSAFA